MSRRGGRNKAYDEESPEPECKRSSKRSSQQPSTSQETAPEDDYDPGSWSCSVCTYRNHFESFKCEICESRKGTSTRKPRLNPSVVQQQTMVQMAVQQSQSQTQMQSHSQSPSTRKVRSTDSKSRFSPESNDSGSPTPSRIIKKQPKLKKEKRIIPFSDDIVYRTSPKKRSITVRNVTFTITEFKAKQNTKGYKGKRPLVDKLKKKDTKKEESN